MVLQIDPVQRSGVIGHGTQIGVDDDIHGQVQGQLAIMVLQVFGTLQVLEDDVQDFMADAVSHLVNRQGRKMKGLKYMTYFAPLKFVAVAEPMLRRISFPIWKKKYP